MENRHLFNICCTVIQKIVILLIACVFSVSVKAQKGNYISLKQKTEVLDNRKKATKKVDLYFDKEKQVITKYYYSSPDFVTVVNPFGEVKTYYPESNEVAYEQVPELSSKRTLIYYFTNNFIEDLGLVDEGFRLVSNEFDGQYYVTTWQPPSTLKGIVTVKMVFENGLPIYSEYQASKENILKKIYYTNYKDFRQFRLPMNIVEISYIPSKDSIISRTSFSDVKVSWSDDSPYFNFKIPEDAKPISQSK